MNPYASVDNHVFTIKMTGLELDRTREYLTHTMDVLYTAQAKDPLLEQALTKMNHVWNQFFDELDAERNSQVAVELYYHKDNTPAFAIDCRGLDSDTVLDAQRQAELLTGTWGPAETALDEDAETVLQELLAQGVTVYDAYNIDDLI